VSSESTRRKPSNMFFLLRKNPFLVSGRRGRAHPALTFSSWFKGGSGDYQRPGVEVGQSEPPFS